MSVNLKIFHAVWWFLPFAIEMSMCAFYYCYYCCRCCCCVGSELVCVCIERFPATWISLSWSWFEYSTMDECCISRTVKNIFELSGCNCSLDATPLLLLCLCSTSLLRNVNRDKNIVLLLLFCAVNRCWLLWSCRLCTLHNLCSSFVIILLDASRPIRGTS